MARSRATLNIRDFRTADADAVRAVVEAAFPSADEAGLVESLRRDGDAAIELVAEAAGEIVGHILFSRLEAPLKALALAPISVLPAEQSQGIGSALVEAGHERAKSEGWEASFVLGDPDYYERFGYSAEAAARFASPYSGRYFMVKWLGEERADLDGPVRHAPAFASLG